MNWIKCADKCPDDERDVLLCSISSGVGVFERNSLYISIDRLIKCQGDEKEMFSCQRFYDSNPVCWMELPEFPKKCSECDEWIFKKEREIPYCKYCEGEK